LPRAERNNTRLVRGEAAEEAARLKPKQERGQDAYIFGTAVLAASLAARNLIDEYRLCLCPIVLGAGMPLFRPQAASLRMTLVESRPLAVGAVILTYRPAA
jgi:dihydrofolate reductase